MSVVAPSPILLLPGANNCAPAPALFAHHPQPADIVKLDYFDARRCAAADFSIDAMLTELAQQVETAVPSGPIYLIGVSIGGHFAYSLALKLQARGRRIGGFAAIDSFMISTADAREGWQRRALVQALEMLRERRLADLFRFVRSKLWRALFRLAGPLSGAVFPTPPGGSLFEEELRMRLLIRAAAPWIASLDSPAAPLLAPAVLLRSRATAGDDAAWRARCPQLKICEVDGRHDTMFDAQHEASFRNTFLRATHRWRAAELSRSAVPRAAVS